MHNSTKHSNPTHQRLQLQTTKLNNQITTNLQNGRRNLLRQHPDPAQARRTFPMSSSIDIPNIQQSGNQFENLRNAKNTPDGTARRMSLNDQKPQVGFFGQLWNTYVFSSLLDSGMIC